MAAFTPQEIATQITAGTKFSEYRDKIQSSLEEFATNINAELVAMFGVLDTETTYTKAHIDSKEAIVLRASNPFSGYSDYLKKKLNFLFPKDANATYKMVDKADILNIDNLAIGTYGEEKVINGNFTNGTTGWNEFNASLSVENGSLKVSGTNGVRCYQIIPTTAGKAYTLNSNISDGTAIGQVSIVGLEVVTKFPHTFIATASTMQISPQLVGDGYFFIDNISVKEVATLDFTNYIPEFTVRDGSNDAVVVNKGNYVVHGEEVINGTFDTDTDWTKGIGWTIGSGVATSSGSNTNENLMSTVFSTVNPLDKYIVTCDIELTSGELILFGWNGSTNSTDQLTISVSGRYSLTLYSTNTQLTPYLSSGAIPFVGTVDNVSMIRKDDIQRATEDTEDMYDYDDTSSTLIDVAKDKVVKHTGNNTVSGTTGHYYKCILAVSDKDLTTTSLFGNITYFIDLGTAANMSTTNPYFEARDYVSNQVLACHTTDQETNLYEGISYNILFNDVLSNMTQREVMLSNGFAELSQGVYTKDTKKYLPIGYLQTLNKGSYHPWFNSFGTAYEFGSDNATRYDWHSSGSLIDNSSKCFLPWSSGVQGVFGGNIANGSVWTSHPQGKFYDVIYEDDFIDLRLSSKLAPESDVLDEFSNDGVSNALEPVNSTVATVRTTQSGTDHASSIFLYISKIGNEYKPVEGSSMYHNGVARRVVNITEDSSTWNCEMSTASQRVQNAEITYTTTVPINSQSKQLTKDLIGDPQSWPQEVIDRLASGKPLINFNALLVGEEGEDYIPDGTSKTFKFSKKVDTSFSLVVRSNDNGVTWVDVTDYLNSVFNATTNSYTDTITADYIYMYFYTSNIEALYQSDPLPVKMVQPKTIFSNSFAPGKGGSIVASLKKIPVGNGTNGLGSRTLENAEIGLLYDESLPTSGQVTMIQYDRYLYNGGGAGGIIGSVYERVSPSTTADVSAYDFSGVAFEERIDLGTIGTTPQHNTITLDAEPSPKAKWFNTIAEKDNQMIGQVFMADEVVSTIFADLSKAYLYNLPYMTLKEK